MQKLTQEQLNNTDEIKIVNKLLSMTAHVISKEYENNSWKLQIHTPDFMVVMRFHMEDCPVKVLRYGIQTWTLSVINSRGNRVMFSSSVNPQVAQLIGKLVGEHEEKAQKKDVKKDWQDLEKFFNL